MNRLMLLSRILGVIGVVALVFGFGAFFEGSLVIYPASAVIALSAFLAKSRFRRLAYWGFGLIASEYVVLGGGCLPFGDYSLPSRRAGQRGRHSPFCRWLLAGSCASMLLYVC